MQIVINISENHYKTLQKMSECGLGYYQRAILNGTPLPKGHGDLIDLGILGNEEVEQDNPFIKISMNGEEIEALPLNYLFSLPITIEADKGEE